MTTSVEPSNRASTNDHRITEVLDGPAERSPVRLIAATAAAGMAVAHIPVIKQHLDEAPYIGIGFVLLTIAGLVLLQLLLTRDTAAVWTASVVVSVLALLGYLLSRSVGLPQITDDIGNWSDPLGVVAIVSETVLLLAAVGHLTTRKHPHR